MSNLSLLVVFITIFVISQQGLSQNFTSDSIVNQADGREKIIASLGKETTSFPGSTQAYRRQQHKKFAEYIVNGLPARKGQFPFQVAVIRKSNMKHLNSGAIISSNLVLTAAWWICESYSNKSILPEDLLVHAGLTHLHAKDLKPHEVQTFVCHEEFDLLDNQKPNIALIQIKQSFEWTTSVQPVKLPDRDYGDGVEVTISSWGETTDTLKRSDRLLYGEGVILSLAECGQLAKNDFASDVGCVYRQRPSGGGDLFWHDVGAPVVHFDKLIGLVGEYYFEHVDVYVSVWFYRNWIETQVKLLSGM